MRAGKQRENGGGGHWVERKQRVGGMEKVGKARKMTD